MPTEDERAEPSNFALALSEQIQAGEFIKLHESDIARLTEYERAVLQRTAERNNYKGEYRMDTGEVTLRKVYD